MSPTKPPEGLSACGVSQRAGPAPSPSGKETGLGERAADCLSPGRAGNPLTKDLLFSSLAGGIQVRPERDFSEV